MIRPLCLALLACVGCQQEDTKDEGTAVGNPGPTRMTVARSADVGLEDGAALGVAVFMEECEGDEVVVFEGLDLDLLDPPTLSLPAGTWCATTVEFEDGLSLVGLDADDDEVSVSLFPEALVLGSNSAGFQISDQALVLELATPDWLNSETLGLDGAGDVEIGPEDELGVALGRVVEGQSILWVDPDEDGELEGDEDPVAAGEAEADTLFPEDADAGAGDTGGCGAGGGGAALFLLPLLGWRRSRDRRPSV